MAALDANENVDARVVRELRSLGHDVRTMAEQGRASQSVPDEDVLRVAAAASRAVLTNNRRDYVRLHRDRPDHAGIVIYSADPDPRALALRIDAAVRGVPALAGQCIRVNRPA